LKTCTTLRKFVQKMLKLSLFVFLVLLSGGVFTPSLEAVITRFEFVDPPNDGEQEITDDNGDPGPTLLPSFQAVIESTPAFTAWFNQIELINNQGVTSIADLDEGYPVDPLDLLEGITFLYPYARDANNATPWVLGPLTIDGELPLLFRVDQGPPRAPEIGGFLVEGARTLNLPAPNLRAYYVNQNPSNSEFLMEIRYNRFDFQNTTSLEVSFVGTVTNDPTQFDTDPDNEPNPNPVPGAVPRPESLADVVAQLGRITSGIPDSGPPQSVEVIGDVTTKTGGFPLNVTAVDVTPAAQPNITPAQSGPGLGLFNPLGFDFKQILADGNYEITAGARDAFNNISPGGFNAFGNLTNPTSGTPPRLLIIKDTVIPQDFLLESPRSVFIFGNTPPSVDPPFEDSIWIIRGSVADERGEQVRVRVHSQDSPDIDGGNDTANNINPELVFSTDPFSGIVESIIDATNWAPQVNSPGQVAYRFGFVPEDRNGNFNVGNDTELLVIKDFFPPQTPVFTNVKDGDPIRQTIFTFEGEADNDVLSPNAEHGRMNFEITVTHITTSSAIRLFSVSPPASTSNQLPLTDSLLDNTFLPFTKTINVTDPEGNATGQVETVNYLDRTTAFNNLVYEKYFLDHAINFTNVPDGILQIDLCLLDQVGNKSNPCSSVTVVKDTSGPLIEFGFSESGPDDNYTTNFPTLPNFFGADDNLFRVSLKSPELTIDDGPGGTFPIAATADPHVIVTGATGPDRIGLLLRGRSRENFGQTTAIEVSGGAVKSFTVLNNQDAPTGVDVDFDYKGTNITVNQPPFAQTQLTDFQIRIPLFNLKDGIQEVLRLEGIDNLGNKGPQANITVIRDITPANEPVIEVPGILPGFTKPTIYTNLDEMNLAGVAEPDSLIYVLLPPENSAAGYVIDSSRRIPRTSPSSIPIVGSDFDTLSTACDPSLLTCFFTQADSEGRFQINSMDISTIAGSLTTPTTIIVQAIDSFDNTDPVSSISEVVVHRNTLAVPVKTLSVLNYPEPTLPNKVEIFPDSINADPGLTVFYSSQSVLFELITEFPMLEAPDLSFKQSGNVFRKAGKLPATFPSIIGTFSFRYTYEVLGQKKDFDGPVEFHIEGGRDLFGNSVVTTGLPDGFVVDTVAPNEFSSPPVIILDPVDSVLVTTFVSTRINLTDFFKDTNSTSLTAGIATANLNVRLFGPLQQTPDSLNEQPLSTYVPPEIDFEVGGTVLGALPDDGTYRVEFRAVDRVGNQKLYSRVFVLDRKQIAQPLLITDPANDARVSTMPSSSVTGPYNALFIQDIEANLQRSDFSISNPNGVLLSSTRTQISTPASIYREFVTTSIPATDGTSDGLYTLHLDVWDRTGNQTLKTHQYIYDTQAPVFLKSWPVDNSCVSRLEEAQIQAQENLSFTTNVSGIDPELSVIRMRLTSPHFPYNTHPVNKTIQSTVSYQSQDGSPESTQIAMIRISEEGSLGLPVGGEYDGRYVLDATFQDAASNQVSHKVSFNFDSRSPSLSLSGFGDEDFLTNQQFVFRGLLTDTGPCGLGSGPAAAIPTSHIELRIFSWDLNTKLKGGEIAGPFYPDSIDRVPVVSFPMSSDQADFVLTGSFPGGVDAALFEWRFRDMAGNWANVDRVVKLRESLPRFPRPLSPLSKMSFRSTTVDYFTTSPVQFLRWEPVPEASFYKLHLSRESLTPGVRTTFRILPASRISETVDFSQIRSAGPVVPLTGRDQLYWLVESLDGIGQGSDPNGAFGRGEKLEFDQIKDPVDPGQIVLVQGGLEKPLDSATTFATGTSVHLRWYAPDVLRVYGNEKVYVDFPYGRRLFKGISSLPVESSVFDFRFDLQSEGANGIATVTIDGFQDRAGNFLDVLEADFKVDTGPEYEVKLFQNPVDPLSFGLAFKGIDFDGQEDLLKYDLTRPTPQLFFSQGSGQARTLPLNPMRLTFVEGQQFVSGFTSGFQVSLDYVGDVKLTFRAIDFRGHESIRDVLLHVVPLEGALRSVSRLEVGGSSENWSVRDSTALTENSGVALVGWSGNLENHSPEVFSLKGFEILKDLSLPVSLHPKGRELSFELRRGFQGNCSKLVLMKMSENTIQPLSGVVSCLESTLDLQYTHESTEVVQLGYDFEKPVLQWDLPDELDEGDQEIAMSGLDRISGIKEMTLSLDGVVVETRSGAGLAQLDTEFLLNLRRGDRQMSVQLVDLAGNTSLVKKNIAVLAPFAIESCNVVPNPVRSYASLDCLMTRAPDSIEYTLYDSAGRRVHRKELVPARRVREELELYNNRFVELSNGVYFLRVKASQGNVLARKVVKFAILR